MIRINKNFNNPPKVLQSKSIQKAIKIALANRNADNIEKNHYDPQGKVKEVLKKNVDIVNQK